MRTEQHNYFIKLFWHDLLPDSKQIILEKFNNQYNAFLDTMKFDALENGVQFFKSPESQIKVSLNPGLVFATTRNFTQVANMLLRIGADPETQNGVAMTTAVLNSNLYIMSALVDRGFREYAFDYEHLKLASTMTNHKTRKSAMKILLENIPIAMIHCEKLEQTILEHVEYHHTVAQAFKAQKELHKILEAKRPK